MKKAIFIAATLAVVSAPGLAEGIFLDDLTEDYSIAEESSWESSPYAKETTTKLDAFTGDECTRGTEEQFTSLADANKKKNVECYITHFPTSNIKTRMQSNEDGDVSVGLSWDFE